MTKLIFHLDSYHMCHEINDMVAFRFNGEPPKAIRWLLDGPIVMKRFEIGSELMFYRQMLFGTKFAEDLRYTVDKPVLAT